MDNDFKFEVGSTYKNMKGDFEVVSIKGESMVIQWQDGSEITTTMAQQKRILNRLEREKSIRRQEKANKQKKKGTSTKNAAKKD